MKFIFNGGFIKNRKKMALQIEVYVLQAQAAPAPAVCLVRAAFHKGIKDQNLFSKCSFFVGFICIASVSCFGRLWMKSRSMKILEVSTKVNIWDFLGNRGSC